MIKKRLLLIAVFIMPFLANAQNWKAMGPDDFNQASLGGAEYPALSTSTGFPYLAYVHDYKEITVRKFVANKWQTVADGLFSGDNPMHVKIVFDGATPYVAYGEYSNDGKLTVKKHNGTDWEVVGTAGISGSNIQKIDFVFDGGLPYVAYTDGESNRKLVVKKYNGTSWVSVGTSDISGIYADYPSLVFDENHNPYVVYNDGNNSGKMTIKKYDSINSSWVAISDINLSNIESPRIAFNGGVLYALCRGWGNNNKLSVRKLSGTTWEAVATDISTEYLSGAEISFNSMIPYVMYKEDSNDHKTVVKKLNSNASGWETVGSLSSPQNSMGGGMFEAVPLVMSFLNSVPYIAYTEGDFKKKTLVKQFHGTEWQDLGDSGISGRTAQLFNVASNGVSPYITYSDGSNGRRMTMKKYNGATWELVGTAGFSDGENYGASSLIFNESIPYIAYSDNAHNGKLIVRRYNGTIWETLGSPLASGYVGFASIAFNGNVPYVVYQDNGLKVKKFNVATNSWTSVGSADISTRRVDYADIAFNGTVPYVVYSDFLQSSKIIVKKLNGNDWETVGNIDFSRSYSSHCKITFNNGDAYIVFKDNGGSVTIRKYDTISKKWVLVGNALPSGTLTKGLIFVDNVPYVGYAEGYDKLTIKKFNGNAWETVGNAKFSAGSVGESAMTVNRNKLVVVYASQESDAYSKSFKLSALPVVANSTIYVSENGAGSEDGSSWANATSDLQVAIQKSTANVYVAAGTYKPIYPANTDFTGGYTADAANRDNAFVLKKDVKIYGGFAGSEATLADRDLSIKANASILSGDIDGNDVNGTVLGDNAYHVIMAAGEVGSSILNGFTLTGGNAMEIGSSTVNGYSISKNKGGGLYSVRSSPALENVVITNNSAIEGGGVYNDNSNIMFTNVQVDKNTATQKGGGIYFGYETLAVLTNVTITANTATQGGGMYLNFDAIPNIRNSIIWGNKNQNTEIDNVKNNHGEPRFSFSLVEGSSAGWASIGTDLGNNVDGNPMFMDAANWNYKLTAGSPAINTGSIGFFAAGQTPNISNVTTDLVGNPRFNGVIDMGAYEYEGVLPVNLINFSAKGEAAGVNLTWQTASEQDNEAFTISRSKNGIDFNAIGTVQSKGNNRAVNKYAFLDHSPAAGINYYRLAQQDINWKTTDLGVRAVDFAVANSEPFIFPNPTVEFAHIKFTAGIYDAIALLDITGKVLSKQTVQATQNDAMFNLGNYRAGTYILRLSGKKYANSYKVVKF